jgi:hypothetical protein
MTMIQIASMKPTQRAASIFHFPPCRTACLILRHAAAPGHPVATAIGQFQLGEAVGGLLGEIDGVKYGEGNNHRGDADTQNIADVMSSHALARLLRRHHGARLIWILFGYGAVLRSTHGLSPTVAAREDNGRTTM